jgi:hypothetical protein
MVWVGRLEVPLEGIEAARPQLAVRVEPGVDLPQRLGAQLVEAALGVLADADETGLAQDAEVLGGAGLAQPEVLDELADRPWPVAEEVQDVPPSRLGEGSERSGHPATITNEAYNRQGM